jgi:metallophosphoesterase (TIGR03767 family)
MGFPLIEGFFDRVVSAHSGNGLATPWYSVFGNHDDSIGGSIPAGWTPLEDLYTGTTKFTGFTSRAANSALAARLSGKPMTSLGNDVTADRRWQVTSDERRRPFTPREFMAAHLAQRAIGAGPLGHGFTTEAVQAGVTYYTFPISPGVTGISLDSTNHEGGPRGSLGGEQFAWLTDVLRSGNGTYFNSDESKIVHAVDDELFVIFSHHTSGSMDNAAPDAGNPSEPRYLGPEILALLQRFPTVIAWVNGHTHSNSIAPRPGPSAQRGLWEITTASHVDFPQQARIIEVCDNRDGTLSLFTTLIESAAPYQADYDDSSQLALASLYREFALNDLHYSGSPEGRAKDGNTELLITNPLA